MNVRAAVVAALAACALTVPLALSADTATDIQGQIDANSQQIDALSKEIAQYQSQLDATTKQKNTLQNTVNQLALQVKQLNAKISVTKKQINSTQLQIQELSGGIADKQASIEAGAAGLGQSLQRLSELDAEPLAIRLLSAEDISSAWQDADEIASLEGAIRDQIAQLGEQKRQLTDTKTAAEQKKAQLLAQQRQLTTQQGSLSATKSAQSELLAETRNKEANYQALIAQKEAAKQDFENTLRDLQSKLSAADTSSAPSAGTAALRWPLAPPIKINQYFGDTAFSRTAAYNGQGHNGIDLATRTDANPSGIGTPVYAARGGTVWDINFGVAPNCQYGKWVLIKHDDGLATLYAHLSDISVAAGEGVTAGELIGYSGQTGYATGPHLHFTVYVSSGVSFSNYRCNSGRTVKIPISPFNGYLNPVSYLPPLS